MKFLLWSDIHEEFEQLTLPEDKPDVDAILVAGDIWTKGRAVTRLERIAEWAGVPIIATAGNHDYYGDSIYKSDERMQRAADQSGYDIRFLNPGVTVIGNCRIVGATLWTDYALRNTGGSSFPAKYACQNAMNDHVKIRWGQGDFRKVSPGDLERLHHQHKSFIEETLNLHHDGPTLVMTHHAPSEMSVKFREKEEMIDHAYASNLENLILDCEPQVWVHGHTHNPEDYEIGTTRVLSNPKGYPGQDIAFDMMKVFTCEEVQMDPSPAGL